MCLAAHGARTTEGPPASREVVLSAQCSYGDSNQWLVLEVYVVLKALKP